MRYVIETTEEGNNQSVWNTINSLKEKGLIHFIEKGDPIEEMKENLRKVARAIQLLNEIGISNQLMESYIYDKTKISKSAIRTVLNEQSEFFNKLGVKLK